MANNSKLYITLGVRDNLSKTIQDLMKMADTLDKKLNDATELANARKNVNDLAKSYEKIDETVKRLQNTRLNVSTKKERDEINSTIRSLKGLEAQFKNGQKSGDFLGEKGAAAFLRIKTNLDIAIKAANKYIDTITTMERKMSQLTDIRVSLRSAIDKGLSEGVDVSEANKVYRQLVNREGYMQKALEQGKGLPASMQGKAYEDLIAKAKELAKTLGVDVTNAQEAAARAAQLNVNASQGLVSTYDKLVNQSKNTNTFLNQLGMQIASTFSVYAVERFLKSVIQIGGEFEVQRIALQNILGDAQKANTLFQELKGLAVESPFSFRQQVTFTKQLSAFGIPYSELFDTTKRLADMSAGLGVDMSRLILAYGQVRSAAVLRGQELRQFTEAGIPLVRALADEFTRLNGTATTTGDVFKLISQRAVPFEMVQKILWDMTDEQGRFYNMQFKLSDTLAGKWSNLRDAWEIMLSEFASGESTGGRVMKSLVTLTTELIKGMTKLSPLIYGALAGSTFKGVGNFVANKLTGGFQDAKKNIAEAQRLYEIEIRRRAIMGEISIAERDVLLTRIQNKQIATGELALAGRLNALQIYSAYQTKDKVTGERLISDEYLKQAVELGIINAKEQEAIMNGKRRVLIQEQIGKKMNIGGFGWVGVAIGLGTAFYQAYSSWIDGINQQVSQAVETARNASREIGNTIDVYEKNDTPTDKNELSNRVKAMKEILEANSLYTDEIKAQVENAGNLNKQYEVLLKTLKEAKEQQDWLINNKQTLEEGIKASSSNFKGGWDWAKLLIPFNFKAMNEATDFLFNDDINKNFEQYSNALDSFNAQADALSIYKDKYVALIDEMSGKWEDFAKLVKGKTPEEALIAIADSEYWGMFSYRVDEAETGFAKMVESLTKKSASMSKHMAEMTTDDFNRMFTEIAKIEGLTLEQYKENCNKAPEYTKRMITSIVASMKSGSVEARARLAQALLDFFGLASEKAQTIVKDSLKQQYKDQTNEGKHVLGTLIQGAQKKGWGNEGNGIWDVKWINKYFSEGKGYAEGIQSMVSAYQSLKEEREAAVRSGAKLDKQQEQEWNRLEKAAEIYNFKEKKSKLFGSDSNKKGSKEDQLLKDAKVELDEYKSFLNEYKKYEKVYGKEKSISVLATLFPTISEEKAKNIVDNYKGVLEDLLKGVPQDTDERKKFGIAIARLISDVNYDEAQRNIDKALRLMEEYIQDATESWNLYKALLGKTGDKEFAMQAFVNGVMWDDLSRGMADKLWNSLSPELKKYDISSLFELDEEQAKKMFAENTDQFKLWQDISKKIHDNWKKGLEDVASATEKLMTTEQKMMKIEQEMAYLRTEEGAGENDPRMLLKQQEMRKLSAEAFENSEPYLKFYAGIFAMTIEEAEKMGMAIKDNLVRQLADGTINADKYLKSIKNVDQQLQKMRSQRSDAMTLLTGGYKGLLEKRRNTAESDVSAASINVQKAREELDALLLESNQAVTEAEEKLYAIRINEAQATLDAAEKELAEKQKILGWTETSLKNANDLLAIAEIITGVFDGLQKGAQQISEMMEALGHQNSANTWSDISDTIGAIASPLNAATAALKSAMNGDVGGAISNTVGIITNPITAFAKLHDKKLERQIQNSQREVKKLADEYENLQSAIESALGGIYSTGGYDEMYANLQRQRDEMQKQYNTYSKEKNTDPEKLADYQKQLDEIEGKLKDFALDMAKSLYDIDIQGWAQQLGDSLFEAWKKGEDGAEAFRKKTKEIIADITKNIMVKRVIEKALEPISKIVEEEMDVKNGQLDEGSINRIAVGLGQIATSLPDTVNNMLNAVDAGLQKAGYGSLKDETEKSSSMSSTIKGISENTADLLASYINAIRADVSVNRFTLTQIQLAVESQRELPAIAQWQLNELQQINVNTGSTAEAIAEIYALLHANILGNNQFNIK